MTAQAGFGERTISKPSATITTGRTNHPQTISKAIGQASHPPDPIIHDNTPACGGIIIYLGVWWVAKLGQLLCAWLRMFFFRLVVMAAHGLRMVRPSKTGLRGHRLALPPIRTSSEGPVYRRPNSSLIVGSHLGCALCANYIGPPPMALMRLSRRLSQKDTWVLTGVRTYYGLADL